MPGDVLQQHPMWLTALTALVVAMIVAYAAANLAARIARTLLIRALPPTDAASHAGPVVQRPVRIVRAIVFLALVAALTVPALDLVGAKPPFGISSAALSDWLFGSGLRIVVIATVTYLVVRIVAAAARRLEEEIGRETSPDLVERLKRARTLSGLVQNFVTTAVVAIALLMVLRELQIDILPILTGAGIVGLAVGFGAQTLVKDLIAGIFLTFENQVRVGDVVTINGTGGLVEAINLRTIVLRDAEGVVHVFPNGSVDRLSNRTKDFAYYVIDLSVSHKEDPDEVMEVVSEIGAELAADPRFAPSILEPLEIFGVDSFQDSGFVVKLRIKTLPLRQWDVGRELRRRIKKTFDAKGIEMPARPPTLLVNPVPVRDENDRLR
jgi:small conductance mechanosensitive channel